VELALVPLFGWVSVATLPPGLPVTIDGQPAGVAPLARVELEPGPHEIVAEDECHARAGERVSIARNVGRDLTIRAEEKHAALDVVAQDESGNALEASVLVDGREVGAAPLSVEVPACAKHLSVRGPPERVPFKQELALAEGETKHVVATLGATVSRTLTSEPEGAAVSVDGVPACGSTPCTVQVPVGRHHVAMTAEGYDPHEEAVDLTPDAPVSFVLVNTREREGREAAAGEERWRLTKRVGLGVGALAIVGGGAWLGGPAFVDANAAGSPGGHAAWLSPAMSALFGAYLVDDGSSMPLDPLLAAGTLSMVGLARAGFGGGGNLSEAAVPVVAFLTGAALRGFEVLPDLRSTNWAKDPSLGRWIAAIAGAVFGVASLTLSALATDHKGLPLETFVGAGIGLAFPLGLKLAVFEADEDRRDIVKYGYDGEVNQCSVAAFMVPVFAGMAQILPIMLSFVTPANAPAGAKAPKEWLVGDLAGIAVGSLAIALFTD
jgi:hypothetical protein